MDEKCIWKKYENKEKNDADWYETDCHHGFFQKETNQKWVYCPWCGKKIDKSN